MKVLIGTPIHICKDYSMERWLENVSGLEYPADFLMVDNSPGIEYMERVRGYCAKYGIKNYTLEHLEIDQQVGDCLRIDVSEEMIRQHLLSHDYDAWFSWECDQIIPTNALDKLVGMMEEGNFMMVNHNSWFRLSPGRFNTDMGCALIKRECMALENNWFMPKRSGVISHSVADRWQDDDLWLWVRILKSGGNFINVYGAIDPIYHLDK
jgi:hypothetical protein